MSLVSFLFFSLDIDSHIYKQRDTDQLSRAFLLAKPQTHTWVSGLHGPHSVPSRKSTKTTHHPSLARPQLLLEGPAAKYLLKQLCASCWGEGLELSHFSKRSLTTNLYRPVPDFTASLDGHLDRWLSHLNPCPNLTLPSRNKEKV